MVMKALKWLAGEQERAESERSMPRLAARPMEDREPFASAEEKVECIEDLIETLMDADVMV